MFQSHAWDGMYKPPDSSSMNWLGTAITTMARGGGGGGGGGDLDNETGPYHYTL